MDVRHSHTILRTVAIVALMAIVGLTAIPVDDSDADMGDMQRWVCYGYDLTVTDRNFDGTYSSISWRWAFDPEGLDSSEPVDGRELRLSFTPADIPPYGERTVFIREEANVSGELRTSAFYVTINPLPTSGFVLFMYDSEHVYAHQQVTSNTSVRYGTEMVVPLPAEEPTRGGYTFGGWFLDEGCTVPYDETTTFVFSGEEDVKTIHPKWVQTSVIDDDRVFVEVAPVSGLAMGYDGSALIPGSTFTMDVRQLDGFRFDLSDLVAFASDGTELQRTDNGDGSYTFTLGPVEEDVTVVLTGYEQYFRLTTVLDGVTVRNAPEWIPGDGPLTLVLETAYGYGMDITVYMSGVDVTPVSILDDKVVIRNVTGNVTIVAHATEEQTDDFPTWVVITVLAALAAAIIVAVVIQRRDGE